MDSKAADRDFFTIIQAVFLHVMLMSAANVTNIKTAIRAKTQELQHYTELATLYDQTAGAKDQQCLKSRKYKNPTVY